MKVQLPTDSKVHMQKETKEKIMKMLFKMLMPYKIIDFLNYHANTLFSVDKERFHRLK